MWLRWALTPDFKVLSHHWLTILHVDDLEDGPELDSALGVVDVPPKKLFPNIFQRFSSEMYTQEAIGKEKTHNMDPRQPPGAGRNHVWGPKGQREHPAEWRRYPSSGNDLR
jgi:hypothetical protein